MKAADISCVFLSLAGQNGEAVTNLKLQKLLYYAQAWHLAVYKKPLFDDKIEAWAFGPVIREVYCAYKDCCFLPIKRAPGAGEVLSKQQAVFLNKIYETFMPFTARQLMHMTQLEEPWLGAYRKDEIAVIPQESMKSFYSKMLKKAGGKK